MICGSLVGVEGCDARSLGRATALMRTIRQEMAGADVNATVAAKNMKELKVLEKKLEGARLRVDEAKQDSNRKELLGEPGAAAQF